MQILITHGSAARSRVIYMNGRQLGLWLALAVVAALVVSAATYHLLLQTAARQGWPVVGEAVRFLIQDEFAQRDRFMRENLDAMAQRLGEIQAKLVRLDVVGERVSAAAGVKPAELELLRKIPSAESPAAAASAGQGGPYLPLDSPSLEQLQASVQWVDESADRTTDLFTLIESRLLEARMATLMIPNSKPVDAPVGSGFGFRSDPFTGRPALHAGLDFPAEVGTPIRAAAGGVVVTAERHPQYGQMIEIDHGNGLVTRYAHASRLIAKPGDLVLRDQHVADVGNTGRSTGPHLHFEVLVGGVPQNPARFLAGMANKDFAQRVGVRP
jgi:murein DD-endopeptidase MepM/ murein hydrolase activator NlpD